jgi:glycosyltransferase involved in cell wall biosynthesis
MPSRTTRLRVLFVSHTAELNGAEKMLLLTLQGLNREKFAPLLVVPRPGPLIQEAARAGIRSAVVPAKWWLTTKGRVWTQPLAWLWNIPSVMRLKRLVRREAVGLVFTNSVGNFGGAVAAKLARVPHIWSVHEILSGRERLLSFALGGRMLVRLICGLSEAVIVNSAATAKAFGRRAGVRIVPNGLDPGRAAGRRDEKLRARLGFERKHKILGLVGKVTPDKGQREAILALAGLAERRPELRLLLAGAVGDRKYFRELQEIARRNGLEGRIVFAGYVPDIFACLRLMDLLLIASRTESFGRTAIEAMAAGTPVLAVSVGGLPEIISHGRNGFLVDSAEPGVLGREIGRLLDRPAALREAVRNGRRTAEKKYALPKIVKQVEALLLEHGRSGGACA